MTAPSYFDPAASLNEDLLREGWYKAVITSSFYEDTQKGERLKVVFEIKDGDHRGATVWDMFCLGYSNPKAVWYANKKLQELCIAAGQQRRIELPNGLIGIEVKILVSVSVWNNKEKNEVKEYACTALNPTIPSPAAKDPPVPNHASRKPYAPDSQQDDLVTYDDNLPF